MRVIVEQTLDAEQPLVLPQNILMTLCWDPFQRYFARLFFEPHDIAVGNRFK